MKKLISLLTIFVLCIGFAVPMYAASGGWTALYEEPTNSTEPIDKETEYIEALELPLADYSADIAVSSGNVLHIKFARAKKANTWLISENSLTGTLVKNKKYDFSFYAKGDFQANAVYAGIGTSENATSGGMVLLSSSRCTKTSKDNGWTLYQFTNINYNDSGNHFRIKVAGLCEDIYIDNVSLKLHGDMEELIVDGGFEDTSFVETEDLGNQAQYAPKNLIATQRSEHIMLSWKNPANPNLSKVTLYEVTTGGDVKVADISDKTKDAYVNYDVTGLAEGSKHTYKIVYDFGKVTSTEALISATASEIKPYSMMNVSYNGNHPGTAYIERNDTHSGGGALRLISNKASWSSNNYIHADTKDVNFSNKNEYEVSVWVKGLVEGVSNTTSINTIRAGWDKFASVTAVATEGDWTNMVYSVSAQDKSSLMIITERDTDVLIDDLEVWQLSEGVRTTQIFSMNFDSEIHEVEEVSALTGTGDRNTAKISFAAPEEVQKIRVYVKDGEELSKRAEVYAENGIVTFNHLKNDYNYTYVVKAVDAYNNESTGLEVTITPTPPDWECSEFGLYRYGAKRDDFGGFDTYTAKATLKNNKIDEGVNAQIIAILRKDGERVDAVASSVTNISKTKYDDLGTDISANIDIGDLSDGEYEISVYLWDGLDTMTILKPFKIYKENNE